MKTLLLSACPEEIRLAVVEEGRLTDYMTELTSREDLVGRVYKGVVKNAVPAVSGFFVDIGLAKNGFLREEDCLPGAHPTEGASLLVQVVKDSTATKGPLLTGKISLQGKYSVLLNEKGFIGVSRKIRSEKGRQALRRMAKEILPGGVGLIVRTAAGEAPEAEVEQELRRLAAAWQAIGRRCRITKAPALLYRGKDLTVRACREFLDDTTDRLVTDDRASFQKMEALLQEEAPEKKEKLFYEPAPLFQKYHVEDQVNALFDREVPLPSGGSLVFDYAEALTAVDVNSGSFRQDGIPHGEAAYLVNREAAEELLRQVRMRGIGGMILVDFIDMEKEKQKEDLLALLRKGAARDRVTTVVLGITRLGLVEMTRKRTTHRLMQNYYEPCPVCGGTGMVPSEDTMVLRIHEALAAAKAQGTLPGAVLIECHPAIARRLEEEKEKFRLVTMAMRPVRIAAVPGMRREVFSILADHSPL